MHLGKRRAERGLHSFTFMLVLEKTILCCEMSTGLHQYGTTALLLHRQPMQLVGKSTVWLVGLRNWGKSYNCTANMYVQTTKMLVSQYVLGYKDVCILAW